MNTSQLFNGISIFGIVITIWLIILTNHEQSKSIERQEENIMILHRRLNQLEQKQPIVLTEQKQP